MTADHRVPTVYYTFYHFRTMIENIFRIFLFLQKEKEKENLKNMIT